MITKDRYVRKRRIRSKMEGTATRPRISVFRSNYFMYAQAIDDQKGVTLASAKSDSASEVGKSLGEKLLKIKIKSAVFDRSGYRYHGRVKAVAESLREIGVQI